MDAPVYCIHCGATIPADAAFCPSCGRSQSGAASSAAELRTLGSASASVSGVGNLDAALPQPSGQTRTLILLGVVAAVVLAAFAWLYLSNNPPLSDAASIWCKKDANYLALNDAADQLGIDKGHILLVLIYEKQGETAGSAIKAEFARVCNAAFGSH